MPNETLFKILFFFLTIEKRGLFIVLQDWLLDSLSFEKPTSQKTCSVRLIKGKQVTSNQYILEIVPLLNF